MRKIDVKQRSPNPNGYFGELVPTINVKWYPWPDDIERKFRDVTARGRLICQHCRCPKSGHGDLDHPFKGGGLYHVHEFGDDVAFWRWWDRLDHDTARDYPNGEFCIAEEITRETGWELAQEDADYVWENTPYTPKIESSGRSGGHLIVKGLPEVEHWDAIDLARWARYVRWVKGIVDTLDEQWLWHLHVNVWEAQLDHAFRFYRRFAA